MVPPKLRYSFLSWDESLLEIMGNFPMHKFRSPPVAYIPMGGQTGGGLLAAIYEDGKVAAVTTVFDVKDVDAEDELQEQFLAAGAAVHDGELAVTVWDSTAQKYKANLYKVADYSLKKLGMVELVAPSTGEVLCGLAHGGGQLVCVWIDGSVQIYGPRRDESGVGLIRSFKLSGFNFFVMKEKCGSEDLRTVPLSVSVCSGVGEDGLVVVVGPRDGKQGLKFVVLDSKTGMVQSRGVLCGDGVVVDAPVKLIAVDGVKGRFRVVVGGKDMGEEQVPVQPNTLAKRLGSKPFTPASRKRKLVDSEGGGSPLAPKLRAVDDLDANDLVVHCGSDASSPAQVTFSLPPWAMPLTRPSENGLDSLEGKSDLHRLPLESLLPTASKLKTKRKAANIGEKVVDLMDRMTVGGVGGDVDSGLVDEAMNVLRKCKEHDVILTVDLVGLTAGRLASLGDGWDKVDELLSMFRIKTLSMCPSLLADLFKARRFDLMNSVLRSLQDASVDGVSSLLKELLNSHTDETSILAQLDHHDRIRSSTLASVSTAEGECGQELVEAMPNVVRQVESVRGFSPTELLMHRVVDLDMDSSTVFSVLRKLSVGQASRILAYITKCIDKHSSNVLAGLGGEEREGVPQLKNVLNWSNNLLATHMAAFAGQSDLQELAESLLNSVQRCSKAFEEMTGICGALENVLKSKHVGLEKHTAKAYSITVLDLTVDMGGHLL